MEMTINFTNKKITAMKKIFLVLFAFIITAPIFSQKYTFTVVKDIQATSVKSQGHTGTCWSFSTSSFVESEIKRLSGLDIPVSEMYFVRNTYMLKAWNYVMRQGNAQFGEGGLAHDVTNAVREFGIVPRDEFTGLLNDQKSYDHEEMSTLLKTTLDEFIKSDAKKSARDWEDAINQILDTYMGKNPITFNYNGNIYSPKTFVEMTKFNPDDYVSITSFTQQPFYSKFILNIPDNFSNGSFYNVSVNDMIGVINTALANGFTISLDVDVSEPTFSAKNGVAVLPLNADDNTKSLTEIVPEQNVTQLSRQQNFENYTTTDDHLMHITGMLTDQKGTTYYKVKNSWGNTLANGGYVYMSEIYAKMKFISVMVHKDALSKELKALLKL